MQKQKPDLRPFLVSILSLIAFLHVACNSASGQEIVGDSEARTADTVEDLNLRQRMSDMIQFRDMDSTKSYNQIKAKILVDISKIDRVLIDEDSLGKIFSDWLVYRIIPYWYDTPWDFNGYTATPNQGVVACGYFVSTVLLHAGLNVNRYKMAQQLPIHEAKTLALSTGVLVAEGSETEEIIDEIDSLTSDGIYFLGFDGSHVGFLLKEQGDLYVIHANYIGSGGVTVEQIGDSQAFASYLRFYLVPISGNKELMRKWVLGEEISVVQG